MPRRSHSPSPSSASTSSSTSDSGPSIPLPKSLPDLRFEQSYLATIRAFVQEFDEVQESNAKEQRFDQGNVEHSSKEKGKLTSNGKGKKKMGEKVGFGDEDEDESGEKDKVPKVMEARNRKGEPELWIGGLRIQWAPLLWVTFRDQLISPLVQGAVWGLVGVSLAQLKSYYVASRKLNHDLKSQRTATSSVGLGKGIFGKLGLGGTRR